MLRTFHPDHLPMIGEFLITGMVWLMALSLKSNDKVSEFMEVIKDRCLSQGMDEDQVRSALEPLDNAIKLALKEYKDENNL